VTQVQLLRGPVRLRTEREAQGIVTGAKHALDDRLSAVDAKDPGRAPVVLIGHVGQEHDAPEPLRFQAIERRVIDCVGEGQRTIGAEERHRQHVGQQPSAQAQRDLGLEGGARAALAPACQPRLQWTLAMNNVPGNDS